jgi:hypothetical protein
MQFKGVLFLVINLIADCYGLFKLQEQPRPSKMLELDASGLQRQLEKREFLLVLFYASNCGASFFHSKFAFGVAISERTIGLI